MSVWSFQGVLAHGAWKQLVTMCVVTHGVEHTHVLDRLYLYTDAAVLGRTGRPVAF